MPQWEDLTAEEKTALKRLNRGPHPDLSETLGMRLISLGLAEERNDAIGINRAGRELVISALLDGRKT
ncbi:hypothetical protein N8E89_23190 (plasmid) [Phyllobacterium sp. A18/5-2]|uniref:hypothetical protein n=1 Tax=Phyllobacterium sp. A18/5-2 TaxID=2978392 RepID=UPI0021C598AD|nr:hypothetical protein [Phyllobacterium sp. A18/5-2]UXN66123.1 hypothetical protein N8E89_23190 [Phyllobacterium sp. A18/5-2]